MSEKQLGTMTPWGIVEPFPSNELTVCLHCGVKITDQNDSGWEGFCADGRTTQPECKDCFERTSKITKKSDE